MCIRDSLTGLKIEDLVGIMSGSVTNTPGLGAAKNTIEEIKNSFPDKTFDDPTIGYAITYPLGVFGIIGTIILSKLLLKINPEVEMRKFRMSRINRELPLTHKKMRVTNPEYFGKTLHQVLKAVSYTHLDVYKRQFPMCFYFLPNRKVSVWLHLKRWRRKLR